jgi:hypothetical protein
MPALPRPVFRTQAQWTIIGISAKFLTIKAVQKLQFLEQAQF